MLKVRMTHPEYGMQEENFSGHAHFIVYEAYSSKHGPYLLIGKVPITSFSYREHFEFDNLRRKSSVKCTIMFRSKKLYNMQGT